MFVFIGPSEREGNSPPPPGQYVICAVPPPQLRAVRFQPPFSPVKQEVVDSMHMGHIIKFIVTFEKVRTAADREGGGVHCLVAVFFTFLVLNRSLNINRHCVDVIFFANFVNHNVRRHTQMLNVPWLKFALCSAL